MNHLICRFDFAHFYRVVDRFRPIVVREIIHLVLKDILTDKVYNSDDAKLWTREISDCLQNKLKGLIDIASK